MNLGRLDLRYRLETAVAKLHMVLNRQRSSDHRRLRKDFVSFHERLPEGVAALCFHHLELQQVTCMAQVGCRGNMRSADRIAMPFVEHALQGTRPLGIE